MSLPVHLVEPGALSGLGAGAEVEVGGDEGRHAVSVRRARVGEWLELVDGHGTRALATVTAVSPPSTLVVAVDSVTVEPEPSPRVVVVQALPKGDRGETAVETLTEVGVDEVVPWQAQRSVARWAAAKAESGAARWRRTATEAAKQSRRARVPVVAPLADLDGVVRRVAAADLALLLDEGAERALASLPVPAEGEVLVVVGPEGGVAPEEAEALVAAGAVAVRLGPIVLRTSTAGTVAVGVILSRTGRWEVGSAP